MALALLAWVAGAGLQLQQAQLWAWPVYAYGAAAAVLLLALVWAVRLDGWLDGWLRAHRWRPVVVVAMVALAWLLLAFALTGLRAHWRLAQGLPAALDNQTVVLTGRVADVPQRLTNGSRFVLAVESARYREQAVRVPPQVLLSWYVAPGAAPPALVPGERWQLPARLRAPHGLFNPYGFDRELWLWQQGLGATGTVRAGAQRLDAPGWNAPIAQARHAVAQALRAQVDDARAAGVLVALVVGDQSAIEREDWQVFRATGVAHLMAISGLHVTLFAWLAVAVVGALWRASARWSPAAVLRWPAPHAAWVGGVLLAAAYAVFAGWGVPAQRTVLMLAAVATLRLRGVQWPWPLVWLGAMAVVVALDPWALLQAGFWLSFVAVGVLFASTSVFTTNGHEGAQGWGRAWHKLKALLREQAVVTVALTPLTLLLFGQVSLVGLLANVVAIPWVTLLVTPLALAGVLWSPLWTPAAWAVQALGWGLDQLAAWPWAVWQQATAPWPLALLAVAGGALLVLRLPWALRVQGVVLLWPALAYQPPRPPVGAFDVLVPDVGQGSAAVVRTARHSLLYDSGPAYFSGGDAGERVLVPLLQRRGERLDALLVSHRDADHAGGTESVLASQPQAALMASYAPEPGTLAVQRSGLFGWSSRCQEGQRWVWDGVTFEVLHPGLDAVNAAGAAAAGTNAQSCVLRVSSAPTAAGASRASVVLAGDVGADQELRLSLAYPEQTANVLLAPHHGSASSSSPVWLNTLLPRHVIAQTGHHNRFGHPAPVVLQRYAQRGIQWRTSPACGAATWSSTQPDTVVCEREQQKRYWHASVVEPQP